MSLLSLCNRGAAGTLLGTVARNMLTAQSGGGRANAWVGLYVDRPCVIQPASAKIVEEYMRREIRVNFTIYFPDTLDLKANDRITAETIIYVYHGGGDMGGRVLYTIAHCERIGQ